MRMPLRQALAPGVGVCPARVPAVPGSDDLLAVARRAALEGGRVIRHATVPDAERKGAGDYVTEVDRASEQAIAEVLRAGTPEIPLVGEEGGGAAGERYWVVDPLDGTTNFLHRFPIVGVSVALIEKGRPTIAVVHAPFLGESYL